MYYAVLYSDIYHNMLIYNAILEPQLELSSLRIYFTNLFCESNLFNILVYYTIYFTNRSYESWPRSDSGLRHLAGGGVTHIYIYIYTHTIYIYIYIYVRVYIYIYIYTHTHMHAHIMYVYLSLSIYIYMYIQKLYAHIIMCIYVYTYIHIHTYICIYIYIYVLNILTK